MRKFFLAILSLVVLNFTLCSNASAQNNSKKEIDQLMSELRFGKMLTVKRESIIQKADLKIIHKFIEPYFHDTMLVVRMEAFSIGAELGLKNSEINSKKTVIKDILGNCTLNNSVYSPAIALLTKFKKNDFGAEENNMMATIISGNAKNIGLLCKLYAFTAGELALPVLQNASVRTGISRQEKKDIKLALVRAGDDVLAQKMEKTLSEQVVNDDFIYSALEDVIYTNNKAMYKFLLDAIFKDQKKCTGGESGEYISCSYRLIEAVAGRIKNFPVTINKAGEIAGNNSGEVLSKVKDWIQSNPDFVIVDDTY